MIKDLLLVAFLSILGVFVGWMFGLDFDHRNVYTGSFTLMWLLCSGLVWFIYMNSRKYG